MAEQEAVVRVRRERWERVTESEEFAGRFRAGSRLPQYLDDAVRPVLSWVVGSLASEGMDVNVLDDSDIDRRSCAGPEDSAIVYFRHLQLSKQFLLTACISREANSKEKTSRSKGEKRGV